MKLPNWTPKTPEWSLETISLLPTVFNRIRNVSLSTILEKSENFPVSFPIQNNRCKILEDKVDVKILERNINSAYPVIHESILHLCALFILFKRRNGSIIEKDLYNNIDLKQFIDRLLTKRAVVFLDIRDRYSLINKKSGSGQWEIIGTPHEKEPLVLKDCLSYDEIKLSAFLSISSYTHFLNIGNRINHGKYEEDRSKVQDEGVIVGLIGTRLEKERVMEYQEIVITKDQNRKENGYGQNVSNSIAHLFAEFYEEKCLEFDDVPSEQIGDNLRYMSLDEGEIFDNYIYYKRLSYSIDTLFMEANHRASEKNTTAYIHVVGIGLGVWKITDAQQQVFMNACAERIKHLGPKLKNVSDICFAYIRADSAGDYKTGDLIPIDGHPNGGIKIHIYNREPHARLTGDDSEKLLVVSYPWDGNAFPGNEYWLGSLAGSGDPAAACSTQIPELHNAYINPNVTAENLQIVTAEGLMSFEDYCDYVKKENPRCNI